MPKAKSTARPRKGKKIQISDKELIDRLRFKITLANTIAEFLAYDIEAVEAALKNRKPAKKAA